MGKGEYYIFLRASQYFNRKCDMVPPIHLHMCVIRNIPTAVRTNSKFIWHVTFVYDTINVCLDLTLYLR